MYSPWLTITPIHGSRQLSMSRENQDSANSDSRSSSLLHRFRNSYYEKSFSDLRIDDNCWMQDLKNMQDDSIL